MDANSFNNDYQERLLLERVVQGDQRAFNIIVGKYSSVIYPYLLYWLKQPQLAEELAQDVFLRIWKHREKLKGISNFAGYVFTITRNLAWTELERIMRAPEDPATARTDEALNNPHATLELKELAALMENAIESLPPRRREIFRLSRTAGLTYEEIAAQLNLSRSTVREHMVEALVFLRAYLKKHAGIIFSFLAILLFPLLKK